MSRLPIPLRKQSPDKAALRTYQAKERVKVLARFMSNGMKCEAHLERIYQAPEVHHVFSRGFIVGEPWASSAELTAALCHYDPKTGQAGCHEIITRHLDKGLEFRLRERHARMFYEAHKEKYPKTLNPAGAVRKLAAKLERAVA